MPHDSSVSPEGRQTIKLSYYHIEAVEGDTPVADDVIKAFESTGNAQRFGEPEALMRKIQKEMGGCNMNVLMEHAGDLTHRLTHHIKYGEVYPEIIREKMEIIRRSVENPHFLRHFDMSLRSNAECDGKDPDDFIETIQEKLLEYSAAHENVPVWNRIQHDAKRLAVAVGRLDIATVINFAQSLSEKLENETQFVKEAKQVYRSVDDGKLMEFEEAMSRKRVMSYESELGY